MDKIRRFAYASVLRACSFAALGIFCFMFGTSYDPHFAFKAGGTLSTIATLALIYKAREALTKDYRKTETWLTLPNELRPPASIAQRTIAGVLRETYLKVAMYSALISIVLWVIALALQIFVERR